MISKLISYAGDERRATISGVNLFFSALLGANLGTLGDVPLDQYLQLTIILVGAVTAILTIAITRRRSMAIWSGLAVALLIFVIAFVVGRRMGELADDFQKMAITLGVWLVMLLVVRFTPEAVPQPEQAAELNDVEIQNLDLPGSKAP